MYFETYLKLQIHKHIVRANWIIQTLSDTVIGTVLERHKDVILITGGCSGLGKELVKEFERRRLPKIIVLDINLPKDEERVPGVHYFQCDVSDSTRVLELCEEIKKSIGLVTIVINNAGITSGKPLLELSFAEIERTIKVNLLSSFYINRTFLPDMIAMNRGYVVTVASVLGYMAPSKLTAYGASKSGLIALHESLTYELGPPLFSKTGVKTLLVCPGQLKTAMFRGVNTPSNILAPELEPQYVAHKVVRALECGRRGEMQFPIYGNFLPLFRSLPWPITQFARLISGMDESMNTYEEVQYIRN